jgi:8-oxo-dGTP diphosphatase
MDRPRVGCGVMILKDEKILLGKRHPDPEKASSDLHGEGTWTMPGGKLEFGESPDDCVIRETLEESGIEIKKENLKLISVSNEVMPDMHYVTIGFLCEHFSGDAKVMEPEKITEWKWFPINNLPKPLFVPSENIVRTYLGKKTYSSENGEEKLTFFGIEKK